MSLLYRPHQTIKEDFIVMRSTLHNNIIREAIIFHLVQIRKQHKDVKDRSWGKSCLQILDIHFEMSGRTQVFSIITKGSMAFLQQYTSGLSFSKQNTTKYHQQTVPFTALTMKFSFQISEVARLCDSSRSQQDSLPSCPPKAQNGTEKSPDK